MSVQLQRIHWKAPLQSPAKPECHQFFKAFSDWIPESPEIFVDVADYSHVHDGPKVLLDGHHADYALDHCDYEYGLLYRHKSQLEGSNQEKLTSTLKSFAGRAKQLSSNAVFAPAISYKGQVLHCIINDRASAPNTPETLSAIQGDIEAAAHSVLGQKPTKVEWVSRQDKRRRFEVKLEFASAIL